LEDHDLWKKGTLTAFSGETYAQIEDQGEGEGTKLGNLHDGGRGYGLTAQMLLLRRLCQNEYDDGPFVRLVFYREGAT